MRKRLITAAPQVSPRTDQDWLDLSSVATVEVTSETKDHPVESALLLSETRGWRAARPGTQIIRLLFDRPLKVKRISLVFEETEKRGRRSLFCDGLPIWAVLSERLCGSNGISARQGQCRNWRITWLISLDLTVMELEIIPDKSGGEARASLESWRLA